MKKNKLREIYLKILRMLNFDENELFYIAGNDKLPPPLSQDDERELLIRLMNKDNEAKNILVERNLRLVVYIAKKFET